MQSSNSIIGETIGDRYRIIDHLGKGAFGRTYLAEDTKRPGKPKCAVKQLKPEKTDPLTLETARRLFEREAETLEKLGNHDRIPRLLAHFEEKQEFYLVQEFIDGHDLSEELLPGKQFGEDEVVILLRDILEVLEFVQEHNVIHRDLKPQNMMRRQDGKIVLIDFGAVKEISTQVVNAQGQVLPTLAIGTPGYMAPEQSQGHPKLCSDIYSVGAIAIQALTGIYPHNLPKDAKTGQAVWRDRLQVKVSNKLGDILDKMVCPLFWERYQSAAEVLQDLKHMSSRHKSWIGVGTVALALVAIAASFLAGATFMFIARPPTEPTPKPGPIKPTQSTQSTPPTPPTQPIQPEPVETYENSDYGFRIEYPQTWRLQQIDDPITGNAIELIAPNANSPGVFSAKILVRVETLSEPLALVEYADSSERQIRRFLPQANIVQKVDTTLAMRPAYELTYQGFQDNTTVRRMEVAALWQYKAYVLTYEAEASDYPSREATARQIIDSFELLGED